METEIRAWFVPWIADGKITKRQVFFNRDEALEAVGLSEQATSQENVEVVRTAFEAWNTATWMPCVNCSTQTP